MPTQRYGHRLWLLPYAPVFRSLTPDEQDGLLWRLYAVHDLCELSPDDRAFVREAMMQVADGAAESELPGSTGNFGLIDVAVDSGDDELIERALDGVGRGGYPLSAGEADEVADESREYARARENRHAYAAGDFSPGDGAIWHYGPTWAWQPDQDGRAGGTGPFEMLLVLRIHDDGTLDVCRLADVPVSAEQERNTAPGAVPPPAAYAGQHAPVQVWLRLHPERHNVEPIAGSVYPSAELQKLLSRLHLR